MKEIQHPKLFNSIPQLREKDDNVWPYSIWMVVVFKITLIPYLLQRAQKNLQIEEEMYILVLF